MPETLRIGDFPEADWFCWQEYGIQDLKKLLGDSLTKTYINEAQKY